MNFFIPYHRDGLIDIPEGNREAPAKLEEVVVIDGASKKLFNHLKIHDLAIHGFLASAPKALLYI